MGNSLRCCLACVLPCGALDLIRIVHLSGHVDEITRPVTAGEILQANPNHVLSKPCSQGVVRKILILSPESELKRGSIYFLVPDSSVPDNKKNPKKNKTDLRCRKKTSDNRNGNVGEKGNIKEIHDPHCLTTLLCDKYLEDIVLSSTSEKKMMSSAGKEHRHRRRHSRSASVSTWRPHLDSIDEDLN